MDLMHQVLHDLKFHVNHLIVGYRQKYYSMDNNPRVIHTKLENQQLLSLRTFPNDKHLIDNGQPFLHLNTELEKANLENHLSLFPPSSSSFENIVQKEFNAFDNYKNVTFRTHNSLILKKNYSEPNLVDGYFLSFRLDLEMSGSSSEAGEDEDERIVTNAVTAGVDQPLICLDEEVARGGTDMSEYASSIPCTCNCHTLEKVIPESTCSSIKKTTHVRDKLFNFVMSNLSKVATTNSTTDAAVEMAESIKSKDDLVITSPTVIQQPENSIDEIMSIRNQQQEDNPQQLQTQNNKIWKLVLNDISLSAARLSTGSSNIPMVNNQNIRGDFIDAKIANNENEDIFIMTNMPQNK